MIAETDKENAKQQKLEEFLQAKTIAYIVDEWTARVKKPETLIEHALAKGCATKWLIITVKREIQEGKRRKRK